MLSKKEVLDIGKKQLEIDLACNYNDFDKNNNTVVTYKPREGMRQFFHEDYFFRIITFGKGAVISCDEKMIFWSKGFFKHYHGINCFEYPIMKKIDRELSKYNKKLDVVHEVYLPKEIQDIEVNEKLETKLFEQEEITKLYKDKRFTNALIYDKDSLCPDILAIVAYENGNIIGIAGTGRDCEKLWQIGVDVLPGYRNKGIAKKLVCLLTKEVFKRGAIPYYGTWSSNIASRNLAQSCGYFPAWVEMHCISNRK